MKENLLGHRVALWPRLIALFIIVLGAGIVGYAAWQTSLLPEVEPVVIEENSFELPPVPVPDGKLFISGVPAADAADQATYTYDLATEQWQIAFEYPGHTSFSPLSSGEAVVSVPTIDEPVSSLTAENGMRPAFLKLETGEFNYLATPPGYGETHYRLAPGADSALAYMQRAESGSSESVPMIADWDVIIHRSVPLSNVVIENAMYPQWLSETELVVLQADGLVVHNLETNEQATLVAPYSDYSAANEFALGALDTYGDRQLLLVASATNTMSILTEVLADTEATSGKVFLEKLALLDPIAVFTDPVVSPDGTQFAVFKYSFEPLTGEATGEIAIYHAHSLQQSIKIAVDTFDPSTVSLLGWN
jgi:hypothetical protein